jgi:hypothetical protein
MKANPGQVGVMLRALQLYHDTEHSNRAMDEACFPTWGVEGIRLYEEHTEQMKIASDMLTRLRTESMENL